MKNLTATLCLSVALLFGCTGVCKSADFQRGLTAHKSGDYATALREWTPLAEQGDTSAQIILGRMYFQGQGVSQDYKTAAKWFRLAAEQGDETAQYNLGGMYVDGAGVIQDNVYAHMWINIASFSMGKKAVKLLDFVSKRMTPSQLETAQQLARECINKNHKGC
jgi:TPR repeat protein